MNEVTVLSKAGEGAGYVLGSGVRAARRGSMWMSRSSAAAGLGAARMSVATARAQAAKRAAKQLDAARKDVPSVAEVRQELARRIEPKRRRRWPFVVGALVVTGGIAVVVAARRPVAPSPAPAPPTVDGVEIAPAVRP